MVSSMDWYIVIKVLHIIGSTVLFGTGIGIAFFLLRSHFTDDIREKLYAARATVLADYLFTLPAVCIQPLTGAWLIWRVGYDWTEPWLTATYGLYLFAGVCWVPVIWIQIELKKMLLVAASTGADLPPRYAWFFKLWFALGWPAFLALVAVFYLMVAKTL